MMKLDSWKHLSFAVALAGAALAACSSDATPASNGTPTTALGADAGEADAKAEPAPPKPKPDAAVVEPEEDAGDPPADGLDECLAACEKATPGGVPKLNAIFDCVEAECLPACDPNGGTFTEDAGADGGTCSKVGPGAGKFTMGDPTCDKCLASRCCAPVGACVADTSCDTLNQCADACYANN